MFKAKRVNMCITEGETHRKLKRKEGKKMKKTSNVLDTIAKEILGIETLKTQNNDSLDFHEVSVWSLKAALEKAYQEGAEA